MDSQESKIRATVDFEAQGKSHGHLVIPYSRNDSGFYLAFARLDRRDDAVDEGIGDARQAANNL